VAETKVEPAGSVSTTLTFVAAAGPLFVTVIVKFTFPPATKGPAPATLVIARSALTAGAFTVVVCVAELFAEFGSPVVDVTVAVLLTEPVVAGFTFTTSVNTAGVATATLALVAVTVPVPPTGGVEGVQPAGAVNDTNVVPVGITSERLTAEAVFGPALFTVIV